MAALPLALINADFPPYLDAHRVQTLVDLLKCGVVLNPIAVYRRPDEDKWSVGNGFHRLKAAHLLGRTSIDVEVISAPIRPDSRRGQPRRAK